MANYYSRARSAKGRAVKRRSASVHDTFVFIRRVYCRPCDKWSYENRKVAKRMGRASHPGDNLQAYRCPVSDALWHYGHKKVSSRHLLVGDPSRRTL